MTTTEYPNIQNLINSLDNQNEATWDQLMEFETNIADIHDELGPDGINKDYLLWKATQTIYGKIGALYNGLADKNELAACILNYTEDGEIAARLEAAAK